ncbi:acetolactate synthase large subunit [Candidatus Carsonella ruddii PV]|uniref:Acetolactate synthase large subunit n=1 Tax=Carsonella ruddii (strain PV) TaxID=387662 RepID=Q05FL3_CARRP|nr:thiamine pyrophosphate-binding protein [Candidatus Carsonella ruddii]BAF35158.1 acetolactate synthase large subunit [Candidatus Carsonella ruddii PV]
MKFSSSKIIINSLINENVEFIFGYPGGAVLNIYDEIFKSGIKHILVRHEQSAIHMADGYSRSSNKIGVVIVTSGPGYTNCVTGIATASIDYSSIIILCGQVNKILIAQNSFQELNNLSISLPIVKQFYSLNCYYNIPYLIKESFSNSLNFINGPIIINFPKDLTYFKNTSRYKYPFFLKKKKNIKEKTFNINNYKRPIIIIGGGFFKNYKNKNIENLILNTKIPIVSTIMGIGKINYRKLNYLGWIGMHGNSVSNIILNFADLIICLGSRLDDRITNNPRLFAPYAKILHFDINDNSISKTIFCNFFFKNINFIKEFSLKLNKKWWKIILFYKKFFLNNYKNNFKICLPQQIIELVYFVSKGKYFISTDVGQHQMFAAKYYYYNYKRFLTSSGLGTMGFGLPSSIGIKFANKNNSILLITSESSFQMMMQELSTCKQYSINIKILNLNNQSLGMVKQWQELNYYKRYSSSYMNSIPNFKKLMFSYLFHCFNFFNIKLFYYFFISIFKKDIFCFINIYININENVLPIQINNKSVNEFIAFFSKIKYENKINLFI